MKRGDVKELVEIIESIGSDLSWVRLNFMSYARKGDFYFVEGSWEYLYDAVISMEILKSAVYGAVREEEERRDEEASK